MTIPPEKDPRLWDLAFRMADEHPVDWEAERETSPDLGETLERLRQIETVALLRRRAEEGSPAPGDARTSDRAAATMEPLFVWGPLRVVEKIGEGAYGEVYRAWDPALHREVALKLRAGGEGTRSVGRWLEEARRMARVRHPNVLTVHGADVNGGRAGMWTDLLRGVTLEALLSTRGPLSASEAALVGLDLCEALAAVHAVGLIHGDLKAKNVMREGLPLGPLPEADHLSHAGRIVLMDFGAAQEIDEGTRPGPSAGTPLYSAPELLRGERASVRSDLYALGVLLYRMVTGRFPVEAVNVDELRRRLERGERHPLRTVRPDLPSGFVRTVERALEINPADRHPDAAAMERSLQAVLATERAAASTPRRAGAFAVGLLAGAALLGIAWLATGPIASWIRPRFRVEPTRPFIATHQRQSLLENEPGARRGAAVLGLGDIDGDGSLEFAVSGTGAGGTGDVVIYRSRPGEDAEPVLAIPGRDKGEVYGHAMALLGDVNGDGAEELAIGAPMRSWEGKRTGVLEVHFGGTGFDGMPDLELHGPSEAGNFGYAADGRGDLNGDGYADILVGAPTVVEAGRNDGRAFVFFGGPDLDDEPDLVLSSGVEGSQFGVAVAVIGDFNADGHDDFAVGANWEPSRGAYSGRAYVYYGGPAIDHRPDLVLDGQEGEWFGRVARAGDLNGDGTADLAVGSWFGHGYAPASGAVAIFFGGIAPSTESALALRGESRGGEFSAPVALGDVNGDRIDDLAVGAQYATPGGKEGGAVYIYYGGRAMDDVADVRLSGSAPNAGFGASVSVAGDLEGDGLPDLLVGSPGSFERPNVVGRAYLFTISRFHFLRPVLREEWSPGSEAVVAWSGAERARLDLSIDGGVTWTTWQENVGGDRDRNLVRLACPGVVAEQARLRLAPTSAGVSGMVESPVFRISGR